MTRRWTPGKEPTKEDVKAAITNAVVGFISLGDLNKIAEAVMRLYRDRATRKS